MNSTTYATEFDEHAASGTLPEQILAYALSYCRLSEARAEAEARRDALGGSLVDWLVTCVDEVTDGNLLTPGLREHVKFRRAGFDEVEAVIEAEQQRLAREVADWAGVNLVNAEAALEEVYYRTYRETVSSLVDVRTVKAYRFALATTYFEPLRAFTLKRLKRGWQVVHPRYSEGQLDPCRTLPEVCDQIRDVVVSLRLLSELKNRQPSRIRELIREVLVREAEEQGVAYYLLRDGSPEGEGRNYFGQLASTPVDPNHTVVETIYPQDSAVSEPTRSESRRRAVNGLRETSLSAEDLDVLARVLSDEEAGRDLNAVQRAVLETLADAAREVADARRSTLPKIVDATTAKLKVGDTVCLADTVTLAQLRNVGIRDHEARRIARAGAGTVKVVFPGSIEVFFPSLRDSWQFYPEQLELLEGEPAEPVCPTCDSAVVECLGTLGYTHHFRCVNCYAEWHA